ncbi:MAG: NAD(P)-dependent oxidoreductase [Candidatus Margulisbacteria bacterium]|nr:NAD(P)-dependent oxidoreductase [Candidatus Margulisiibacteriota bacterium]MBU1616918.1 NAD(P)-dependent oxidoreductase [Candidatus Margulisiibacteriota bacterium]
MSNNYSIGHHVFIAGFSGFLGKALKTGFARNADKLYLQNRSGIFVEEKGAKTPRQISRDPYDQKNLQTALADSQTCLNAVGFPSGYGEISPEIVAKSLAGNLLHTDQLAQTAAETGVKMFISLSSMAVYYQFLSPQVRVANENSPLELPPQLLEMAEAGLARFRAHPSSSALTSGEDVFPQALLENIKNTRLAYSLGKYLAEASVRNWFPPQNSRLLRIANIYIAGDSGQRIIPSFIRKFAAGEDVVVHNLSRNFIYWADFENLLDRIISRTEPPAGPVNVYAPGCTVPLPDLARELGSYFPLSLSRIVLNENISEPDIDFTSRYPDLYAANFTSVTEGLKNVIPLQGEK